MTRIAKLILLTLLSLSIYSCSDIIINELDDVQVVTISPELIDTTNSAVIHFWWEEEVDADKYRLQIVSPNYGTLTNVDLDTVVTGFNVQVSSLQAGDYEWTVRAVNSISETENPVIHQLHVDEAIDVSSFKIVITDPIESATLGSQTLNLRWDGHDAIDEYTVKLYKEKNTEVVFFKALDFSGSSNASYGYFDTILPDLENLEYKWMVEGRNTTSEALDSEWGYFSVDTTTTVNQ